VIMFLSYIVFLFLGGIFTAVVHEIIHYCLARLFGYRARIKLGLCFRTDIDDSIMYDRFGFVVVVLAPQVISLVFFMMYLFMNDLVFLLLLFAHVVSSAYDFRLICG